MASVSVKPFGWEFFESVQPLSPNEVFGGIGGGTCQCTGPTAEICSMDYPGDSTDGCDCMFDDQ